MRHWILDRFRAFSSSLIRGRWRPASEGTLARALGYGALGTAVAVSTWSTLAGCDNGDLPVGYDDGSSGEEDASASSGGDFGPPVIASVRPPPISGGTLLTTQDRKRAIAADPDRDRVAIVDLDTRQLQGVVALEPGDEPGRAAEDGAGRVHVALRRGGALATIDPVTTQLIGRRDVCPAPRGVAYEAATDRVHVACAGGELVSLAAEPDGAIERALRFDADLRDIVVRGSSLVTSRFRSAELFVIDADGERIGGNVVLGDYQSPASGRTFAPSVAWRTVALPTGGVAVIHQRAQMTPLPAPDEESTPPPYYGEECGSSILHSAVTMVDDLPSAADPTPALPAAGVGAIGNAALPIDLAISPDGERLAVLLKGNAAVFEMAAITVRTVDGCASGSQVLPVRWLEGAEAIAVAYGAPGTLLIQRREPPALVIIDPAAYDEEVGTEGLVLADVSIPGDARYDTGHDLFHGAPVQSVACASCHAEGRDDGRTYGFMRTPDGPVDLRRSQSLAGGVLGTAPFHWDGALPDFAQLVQQVYVGRMGGFIPDDAWSNAFASYVDSLPAIAPSPARDPAAAARGKSLFEDAAVDCSTCHNGPRLTNGGTFDVGTGGTFQVPSLRGVALRAPYLHDGCAATLNDRFGPCGGGDKHGKTSHLTAEEITDLVAYLETL